ncbi:MAG: STAS domain-containing protein [Candidatus Riflebacteria bacterium]|nr:STAS domain-containing protein [Candidatus Riflebacteria bacterium]
MSDEFSLSYRTEDDLLFIKTSGYLNDLGAEKVDAVCMEKLSEGITKVIINLQDSPMINSIGISILIGVIEAIEEAEGTLAFTNMTPTNKKTFEMMGLLQFAKAFDSEEEAAASI